MEIGRLLPERQRVYFRHQCQERETVNNEVYGYVSVSERLIGNKIGSLEAARLGLGAWGDRDRGQNREGMSLHWETLESHNYYRSYLIKQRRLLFVLHSVQQRLPLAVQW